MSGRESKICFQRNTFIVKNLRFGRSNIVKSQGDEGRGGGWVTPIYGLYRYVPAG